MGALAGSGPAARSVGSSARSAAGVSRSRRARVGVRSSSSRTYWRPAPRRGGCRKCAGRGQPEKRCRCAGVRSSAWLTLGCVVATAVPVPCDRPTLHGHVVVQPGHEAHVVGHAALGGLVGLGHVRKHADVNLRKTMVRVHVGEVMWRCLLASSSHAHRRVHVDLPVWQESMPPSNSHMRSSLTHMAALLAGVDCLSNHIEAEALVTCTQQG